MYLRWKVKNNPDLQAAGLEQHMARHDFVCWIVTSATYFFILTISLSILYVS